MKANAVKTNSVLEAIAEVHARRKELYKQLAVEDKKLVALFKRGNTAGVNTRAMGEACGTAHTTVQRMMKR